MEARNRTVEEWFGWVHDGRVVLPRFQRFEAWGTGQIEGILENIPRKPALPVGALLIFEVGSPPPFHARPIVGAPEPSVTPSCVAASTFSPRSGSSTACCCRPIRC